VLKVVGKGKAGRGKKSGISEYARNMGVAERTMKDWACAAQVATKSGDQSPDLLPYTTCLSILHRTPEEDWPNLVARMLSGSWTKEQTERYVDVIPKLLAFMNEQVAKVKAAQPASSPVESSPRSDHAEKPEPEVITPTNAQRRPRQSTTPPARDF